MISQEQEKRVDDYFISRFKDTEYLLSLNWDYFTAMDIKGNPIHYVIAKHNIINIYLCIQLTIYTDKKVYKYFLTKHPLSSIQLGFAEAIDLEQTFELIQQRAQETIHQTLCDHTLYLLDRG